MNKTYYIVVLSALLLSGCGRKDADSSPTPASAQPVAAANSASPTAEKPAPKPIPARLSAEDIAAIEATGKTGLWADVTEVCAKDVKTGVSTMLTWNVKDRHDGRVVVYLIDKNGAPRNFGQGGPVGQKQTGPWLRPGMVFKIRSLDTKQDLSELVISETQC